MSLILKKKNSVLRESILKTSYFTKTFWDAYCALFPASTPGFFRSAVGLKRAMRWDERLKQKTHLQGKLLGSIAFVFGGLMLGSNMRDLFGWIFIIWAILIVIFEVQVKQSEQKDKEDKEKEQDERISNLERILIKRT